MPVDYQEADRITRLSFGKLNNARSALSFPEPGALSKHLAGLLASNEHNDPTLSNKHSAMFASAGVEMWHRAIHSFLCSVALAECSPLWASVSGYYASHYVMRAFAHAMGIFSSFHAKTNIQVKTSADGQFVCHRVGREIREHAFYWKVVKNHPALKRNPLFRENHERENSRSDKSDAMHRNFANYIDHLDSFKPLRFSSLDDVSIKVKRISGVNRYWPEAPIPQRHGYPDTDTVQVLAYQRIVALREFLDGSVSGNRFWAAQRTPKWCSRIIDFDIEGDGLMEEMSELLKPETDLAALS